MTMTTFAGRHEQISEILRQEIRQLRSGVRLESMDALAKRLSVSEPTVRNALLLLAKEGLVEIRHGSGTYATGHPPPQRIVAIGTTTDLGRQASSFPIRLFLLLAVLFVRHGYHCRAYTVPHGVQCGWSELAAEVARGRIAGAVFVAMNPDL